MLDLSKHRLLFFFLALIFVVSATFITIKFTQGYRLDLIKKTLLPTGILVLNSSPSGAQVYIDGKLKTATNSTLSLSPREYLVEIKKTNFQPWQKRLLIEKELVTQAEAFLFPQVPDLEPLTFSSVKNPKISPDGTRIVYLDQGGLWVFDLSDSFFNLSKQPRQIAKSQANVIDFAKTDFSWTPDNRQVLVETPLSKFLLDANQFNSNATLKDAGLSLPELQLSWEAELQTRNSARMKKLPLALQEIISQKAQLIEFSPDMSKVLYIATSSAEIPEKLIPPVTAASTQKESRKIEANKAYVYNLKEDKNFLIPIELPKPTPTTKQPKTKTLTLSLEQLKIKSADWRMKLKILVWLPTSRHLYWIDKDKVVVCEYDGTNLTTVYSGPFTPPFAFISPDGSRLIVLAQTNLGQENQPNLYSVSLR